MPWPAWMTKLTRAIQIFSVPSWKRIVQKPGTTPIALYYLFAGHNLERIADRVTNLAERVIFLGSGQVQELNPEPDEAGFN